MRPLFVSENSGCGAVFVASETDPVGGEGVGEGVFRLILHLEGFVGRPVTVSSDINFSGDGSWSGCGEGE